MIRPSTAVACLSLIVAAMCAAADTGRVDFAEGFEPGKLRWQFRYIGASGFQMRTPHRKHDGRVSLESASEGRAIFNRSPRVELRENDSLLEFWYYAQLDGVAAEEPRIVIRIHSQTDDRTHQVRRRVPVGKWASFSAALTAISPLLRQDVIDWFEIGLEANMGAPHLFLDDVRIRSHAVEVSDLGAPIPPQSETWIHLPLKTGGPSIPHGKRIMLWVQSAEATDETALFALQGFRQAGGNAVAVSVEREADVVRWSGWCLMANLPLYVVAPVVAACTADAPWRRMLWGDGIPDRIVCPLDDDWWTKKLGPWMLRMQQLREVAPFRGILLTTRLAGANHRSLSESPVCVCDACLETYCKRHSDFAFKAEWSAAERFRRLESSIRLRDMMADQETRLAEEVHLARRQLVQGPGTLTVGALLDGAGWTAAGLLRGLSQSETPTLVVDGAADVTAGYSIEVDWRREELASLQRPMIYLPLVPWTRWPRDEVSFHTTLMALHANGVCLPLLSVLDWERSLADEMRLTYDEIQRRVGKPR